MQLTTLFDPQSLAIVFGGTLLATLLRCGWRDTGEALRALAQLWPRPFDSGKVRAELAAQIREIDREGLLRAEPHRFGDGEFDDIADALIGRRSIQALHDEHDRHRERRMAATEAGVAVINTVGELAPVLGLAGTLLSLASLSVGGLGGAGYAQAIGMAVITTFYGLILANFVAFPLSAAVQRRAQAEDDARRELLEWLADGVGRATPAPLRAGRAARDAA